MALPDYIDRAATSASQMLAGFSPQAFGRTLEAHLVGIAFDRGAAAGEARATLDLLVRLLARLHPVLAVAPLGRGNGKLVAEVEDLARSINPAIEIRRGLKEASSCIVVGTTRPPFKGKKFFIGSEGWTAKLGRDGPMGSGASGNPYGAGAAACFAAANVFRAIFGDQLEDGRCDGAISLSMLSYDHARGDDGPLPAVDLGHAHLVGLGAVGNGATWALARTGGLRGRIDLVDHETVDLSNLQRYVLTRRKDVQAAKVDLAAAAFEGSALQVSAHRSRFAEYASQLSDHRFERVAVALDTAADRIALQGALPKWIVNAWTQPSDLGVSRHGFGDKGPCLACLYMPTGPTKSEDEIVAAEIGMPCALMEVRTMLHLATPVSEAFVRKIAEALTIPVEPLLAFAGKPLREFRQSVICGGLTLKLSEGKLKAPAVVPMPFQSALAGIMLAADLVKHAGSLSAPPTTSTRIDLLRPLGTHLHDPGVKDRTGRCICADQDFQRTYRRKYGLAEPERKAPGSGPPLDAVELLVIASSPAATATKGVRP